MATVTRNSVSALPAAMDWQIESVVSQLRIAEGIAAARHRVGKPVLLPSRSALTDIVERLSKALFPNRLRLAYGWP